MTSRRSRPTCRSTDHRAQPSGQKRLLPWYSDWKIQDFRCEHCGWTGKGEQAFPDEVGMMECPACDHGVGYVQFPTLKEMQRAAAEGNPEAIQDFPERQAWVKRMEARMKRFHGHKLCNVKQLPDLDGESLEFSWDLEEDVGGDNEDYQVIRIGDTEIWRELAFFDNTVRFNAIKALLKEKYGPRFKSLKPTSRSLDWLSGDHFFKLQDLTWD